MYNKNKKYIGVGWLTLPANHPFNYAAYRHDSDYEIHPTKSTKNIDINFLIRCLARTKGQNRYLAQAFIFYLLARVWGTGRYWFALYKGWDTLLGE